jgi:hypothetical protein
MTPPLDAWRSISGGNEDFAVVMIQRKARSRVFRLKRPGRDDVIAKRGRERVALLEHLIYGSLIDRRVLRAPEVLGFAVDPLSHEGDRYYWMFLEDLGSRRYDPSEPLQRMNLARWLGALGRSTMTLDAAVEARLPAGLPPTYRKFLDVALEGLPRISRMRGGSASLTDVFSFTSQLMSRVDRHWSELEETADACPPVLIHGDCLPKNIHVVDEPGSPVVPIDWGSAGRGLPGSDLGVASVRFDGSSDAGADVDAYTEEIRPSWPAAEPSLVARLARLGRLLWTVKLISQSLPVFEHASTQKVDSHLRLYSQLLDSSLTALDW